MAITLVDPVTTVNVRGQVEVGDAPRDVRRTDDKAFCQSPVKKLEDVGAKVELK